MKKYVQGKNSLIFSSNLNIIRPRLKTFENLAKVKEAQDSRFKLYEDILSVKREDIYLYDLYQVRDQSQTTRSRFMTA